MPMILYSLLILSFYISPPAPLPLPLPSPVCIIQKTWHWSPVVLHSNVPAFLEHLPPKPPPLTRTNGRSRPPSVPPHPLSTSGGRVVQPSCTLRLNQRYPVRTP